MDRPIIRRRGLMGCLSLAALACAAASVTPADAQQVLAGKGAVTIDLGVLNQLGQPVTGGYAPQGGSYPAYGQPAYAQPAYGQPYAQGYQTYGGLQFPPQQYPVSTLMVQPPAGATPYVPAAVASAPASTMPAMTASAPAASTSTSTTMASSGSSTATGTPPAAASPTPTAVPMLPATTDTGSAASTTTAATTTTTTDTTAPSATVTTGTETTSTTPAATTGGETTTATTTASSGSTSAVPAATPLATETTGTTGTATTGTTGTESTTAAAPAATGTAATGTAMTGPSTSGTASGTQTAAVPPGTATAPAAAAEGEIRIAFPADSADIPDATKAELDALAQKMAGDDNIRIQLLAYASGTSDQASRARRMSLSRALAVRSYLIKAGVRSTRMDVRALGNNVEGSPADRVDIIPKAQ
jgi:outer membrane protein OmpA-like peptidoglycan-associated protein